MQKCATIGYRKELTITEYSLTTSTKVNYKIQKERNMYLVLRLRGETEHDTTDNVTIKGNCVCVVKTEHDTNDNVTMRTQTHLQHSAHEH